MSDFVRGKQESRVALADQEASRKGEDAGCAAGRSSSTRPRPALAGRDKSRDAILMAEVAEEATDVASHSQ